MVGNKKREEIKEDIIIWMRVSHPKARL